MDETPVAAPSGGRLMSAIGRIGADADDTDEVRLQKDPAGRLDPDDDRPGDRLGRYLRLFWRIWRRLDPLVLRRRLFRQHGLVRLDTALPVFPLQPIVFDPDSAVRVDDPTRRVHRVERGGAVVADLAARRVGVRRAPQRGRVVCRLCRLNRAWRDLRGHPACPIGATGTDDRRVLRDEHRRRFQRFHDASAIFCRRTKRCHGSARP